MRLGIYGRIAISFFLGFLLNVFPWGNTAWAPDFLIVVLGFWVMQSPDKINITTAFFCGVLMDIQTSQYLGVHAIGYTITAYLIIFWDRRLINHTLLGQSFVMLQIFFIANLIQMLILWVMGTSPVFAFSYLIIPCLLQACLWPLLKKIFVSSNSPLNRNHS